MSASERRPLVVLIHGILTGQTEPAWVHRFSEWLWKRGSSFECIKRCYSAGPFPMWNVWVKNWRLARALANELEPFAEDGGEINFVTHSNGADVAVKVMRLLAKRGHKVKTAIFVAGAISADLKRAGLYDLHKGGTLSRAFAYCSRSDLALRWRVTWPYGHLGRVGFRFDGGNDGYWTLHTRGEAETLAGESAGFFTRWFRGGHGGYWHPATELATFEQILADLAPIPF